MSSRLWVHPNRGYGAHKPCGGRCHLPDIWTDFQDPICTDLRASPNFRRGVGWRLSVPSQHLASARHKVHRQSMDSPRAEGPFKGRNELPAPELFLGTHGGHQRPQTEGVPGSGEVVTVHAPDPDHQPPGCGPDGCHPAGVMGLRMGTGMGTTPNEKAPETSSGASFVLKNGGAPGGIRTPDPLIRSQMLYPLSYGRRLHAPKERLAVVGA